MTDEIQVTEETEQETENSTATKRKSRSKSTVLSETDKDEQQDSDSVDSELKLGIFALSTGAVIPEFKTEESACFDLTAVVPEDTQVKIITQSQNVSLRRANNKGIAMHQGDRLLVPTGLVFDIPKGYCLEIYPRSGISFSRGISLNNCTAIIDSDYVEEVFVSVNNTGGSQYIENGERIAQAKLVKLVETQIEVLTKKPVQKTSRTGGFGSTGSK